MALLRGLTWGRPLYFAGSALLMSWGMSSGPMAGFSLMVGLTWYLAFAYFLSRPIVNDYFAGPGSGADRIPPAEPEASRAPRPTTSVLRRVISIPFLALGEHLVFSYSLTWFPLSSAGVSSFSILLLFLVPAALCLAGGLALWGWRRWRNVLGVVLVVMSGEALMVMTAFSMFWQMPEFKRLLESQRDLDPGFFIDAGIGCGLATAVALPIGLWLLLRGRRMDREAGIA